MPTAPLNSKCQELGCKHPRTLTSVYCKGHGGDKTKQRIDTLSMYQTPAWRLIRTVQLSKQPLCQACILDGIVKQAEHIDHVFRWNHIGKGAFYDNVFQSLCHSHHSHKTSLETDGIYEHYTNKGVIQYALKQYNEVINK